ncbi:tripartite tricarboxylate transporter substrate binding protein [Acidovorax sp. Be4]|uniref:Tripartite tricarboxylate transporter substrate binding protein n=1 Tax=Acidovorax bellezanensis TaxID=2976702 RepID=A0ABT2PMP0_9BURK|nr:tripartite tricarboxylate transporter substrate binding protein [Acidovorax sp. Be4]MCT9811749.1 tripartite tricarboxylate transporter substrate binding protein [Acidovorax sp. Be4]
MIDSQRRTLLGRALATALLPAAWPALAADVWPSRPIRWVLPYQAGTGPDITARLLANAVSPLLGQAIIVDNKGGAGGNIGARLAAKAAPDGYTWVYSAAPMAANMGMYKDPGYDALKDFRHVMRLTSSDIVLIVPVDSATPTLAELTARMRAAPGQLNYASGGVGTPSHLGVELLLSAQHVQATHVPYKGASELVNAVLGKQVSFGMPIFGVAYPQIQVGKLKAIAIAGAQRNPLLPDVPTLAELGVRGVDLTSWGGISVPAATPDPIVARVSAAFEKALQQPGLRAQLEANGGNVRPSASAQEYIQDFVKEIAFTEAMMKATKLVPL